MCTYIALGLPATAEVGEAREILHEKNSTLRPAENPHLAQALSPLRPYWTYRSHCDCSTSLGSDAREAVSDQSLEAKAAKHRRKGWSEEKIRRWREDVERALVSHQETQGRDRATDLQLWQEKLNSLVAAYGRVGLYLHEYEGPLATEMIRKPQTERMSISLVSRSVLSALRFETLYLFGPKTGA